MSDTPLENLIASIPDYPEPGIVFKDITPLLADARGFAQAIDTIADHFAEAGITKVLGAESRGFIIGAPVALRLGAGFVPVRKPGKLPRETLSQSYDLEYGTDTLEIHIDAVCEDDRVLIVDDLMATGGTAAAQVQMMQHTGAQVAGMAFLLELEFLNPRTKLAQVTNADIFSVIKVD